MRKKKKQRVAKTLWFKPEEFYKQGTAGDLESHLDVYPKSKKYIEKLIKKQNVKSALEIGPGVNPTVSGVKNKVYLDISKIFLKKLEGSRVQGTAQALPFKDKKFDIVVMNEVLPHIPPGKRKKTLSELARVGSKILMLEEVTKIKFGGEEYITSSNSIKRAQIDFGQVKKQLEDEGFKVSVKKHTVGRSSSKKDTRYVILAVPEKKKSKGKGN